RRRRHTRSYGDWSSGVCSSDLDFVRVAAEVSKNHPRTHFVYIGDGDGRQEAVRLAATLGLAKRVHFLGWRNDARELVACFDVFLDRKSVVEGKRGGARAGEREG